MICEVTGDTHHVRKSARDHSFDCFEVQHIDPATTTIMTVEAPGARTPNSTQTAEICLTPIQTRTERRAKKGRCIRRIAHRIDLSFRIGIQWRAEFTRLS